MAYVFILIFWWPATESSGLSPAHPFATLEECEQAARDIDKKSFAMFEYICAKSGVMLK